MSKDNTTSKGSRERVRELRAAIRKFTGRAPVSSDPEYLEQRLSDLRARQRDGAAAETEAWVVLSVSMHVAGKGAVTRIAGSEGIGVSELVRRALAEYAANHGHSAEAEHFGGGQ